jgi:uncharacterized protein YjbI with pentapeptide repeats
LETFQLQTLENLQYISLSNNQITSLELGDFEGLNNLQYLHLTGNHVTNIADRNFNGLNKLEWLILAGNDITQLNLTGATFDALVGCHNYKGGYGGFCVDSGEISDLTLDLATLSRQSFEAIVEQTQFISTASLVGLRFSDADPDDLSSLLAIPTLDHVRVDRALYERYVDEFDAFAALPGNTVTVVPEPTGTVILLGILGTAATCCRRRRNINSYLRATWIACLLLFANSKECEAEIYRWDTGELIPGTESISFGSARLNLSGWNTDARNLRFAELSGWHPIIGESNFSNSDFSFARFHGSYLDGVNFSGANLTGASLHRATAIDAVFAGAILTDADISGAGLAYVTRRGFTKEQLYSTATYKSGNLTGISFAECNLEGWDFSGKNLTNSGFAGTRLMGANFANAIISGTNFAGSGITQEQFYSTANYRDHNLVRVKLSDHLFRSELHGWNFSDQDLTGAVFASASLAGADFTNAVVRGAYFGLSTITKEQIYSTATYQSGDLSNIAFTAVDLSGANFATMKLTNVNLCQSCRRRSNGGRIPICQPDRCDRDRGQAWIGKCL